MIAKNAWLRGLMTAALRVPYQSNPMSGGVTKKMNKGYPDFPDHAAGAAVYKV